MRKGGGKQKGAQFEREVCVRLSKWLSKNTQEDVFWRSAMSGGRATVAAKRGKRLSNQVGDISCIHPIGNKFISTFAIECKYYADLDFKGLITGKGKLLEFWEEIANQAISHKKYPFLVARQNRMPTLVCLSYNGMNHLNIGPSQTILISRPWDLYILKFDRFVQVCVPFV
jgi:hypothetical protein